jgi:YD repeat-containing protein
MQFRAFIALCVAGFILAPTVSLGQNSCQQVKPWSLSGYAGNAEEGSGGDPNWQARLAAAPGPTTCAYTWEHPELGGWWYGYCYVTAYQCAPNQPANAVSETGPSCPRNAPVCEVSKPIDLTTGNTYIRQSDVRVPGLGGGLTLARRWNSLWPSSQAGTQVGMFGSNWRSTYEERVFVGSDGTLKYAREDGSFWSFWMNPSYVWQALAPANTGATITSGSTYWTVTFTDGQKRLFNNSSGSLAAIIDRNGNTTQLSYDSSNRLITVADAASRHLYFSYNNPSYSSQVTNVTSDMGISLSYTYDSQGRLITVTEPDSSTLSLQYNAQSLITAVTDSQGKTLESHTYDSLGRGLTSASAGGIETVTVSYSQ